jgi:glycosyltransferase involved in cell wall biosynthesis
LPRALASVPPGARTLVLDAESRDGTAEIARGAGAEVAVRPWPGFVAARREALERVATPWTLMLDADERLDDDLRAAIVAAQPADGVCGYRLRRTTYLCGRPITGAGWGGERLLRLFRTQRARLDAHPAAGGDADLHERWTCDGEIADLAGTLHHDSYPTTASYREKFARYTAIEARGMRVSSLRVLRAYALVPARFAWLLLRRGGWRDGWRGWFVSFYSALYPAVAAAKALRG